MQSLFHHRVKRSEVSATRHFRHYAAPSPMQVGLGTDNVREEL
jgi:hypothetical protein